MSGFDLPPVTGYDAMFRQRLLGEEAGPRGGVDSGFHITTHSTRVSSGKQPTARGPAAP